MSRSCEHAETRENDWLPDVEEASVRRFRLVWQERVAASALALVRFSDALVRGA